MSEDLKKIRPLWILFSNRWGGAEQVAISDIADLARSGVSIHLFCTEGSPVHAAAMRHPGVIVHPFAIDTPKFFDTSLIRSIRHFIRTDKINLVHITDNTLLWSVVPALMGFSGTALVTSFYSVPERKVSLFLKKIVLHRIDFVTVLSEMLKSATLKTYRLPEKKVKVINLGLDFNRFDPATVDTKALREAWGAGSDTLVIGSVGRFVAGAGNETFLRAAAGLAKYSQYKLKFVLVSEDPLSSSEEVVAHLNEMTRVFHLSDRIHLTQLSENLPQVMAAFDIFVMPGREEVPGLGALEALAMQKPVVLSRVPGADDIVGLDQRYGKLVRAEDAFDLQHVLAGLLKKPEKCAEMGTEGRNHVLKHFDKRVRLQKTLEIYERCFKRRGD